MSEITGQKIVAVRHMTKKEMTRDGWDRPAIVIVLEDGSRIYASRDSESSGPGCLFGLTKRGKGFYVTSPQETS